MDDGRTTEHGYTISSPCEPDGSGELIIMQKITFQCINLCENLFKDNGDNKDTAKPAHLHTVLCSKLCS